MVLGCHYHDLNTGLKRWFFNFRKSTEVLQEGILFGLFSAPYQNGDQYCDVGPLCPIYARKKDGGRDSWR